MNALDGRLEADALDHDLPRTERGEAAQEVREHVAVLGLERRERARPLPVKVWGHEVHVRDAVADQEHGHVHGHDGLHSVALRLRAVHDERKVRLRGGCAQVLVLVAMVGKDLAVDAQVLQPRLRFAYQIGVRLGKKIPALRTILRAYTLLVKNAFSFLVRTFAGSKCAFYP